MFILVRRPLLKRDHDLNKTTPDGLGLVKCFGGSGSDEVGWAQCGFVCTVNSHFFSFTHTSKRFIFSDFN